MKRVLDATIVLIVVAAVAILALYFSGVLGAKNGSNGDSPTSSDDPASAAPSVSQLALSQEQLYAVLTQPDDLAGMVAQDAPSRQYTINPDDTSSRLSDTWPTAATRFNWIRDTYHWSTGYGVAYELCGQHPSMALLKSEVTPLGSDELARRFVDDALVRSYFQAMFFDLTDLPDFHGWLMVASDSQKGTCFEQETIYAVVFEYWGKVFMLQAEVAAEANRDDIVTALVALVPPIVTRADAYFETAPPPTPMPESPALLTAQVTLQRLPAYMPTLDEMGLSKVTYSLNRDVSRSYTLEEFAAAYRNLDLTALADAINRSGRTYGMLGQEVRIWDTGSACPDIIGMAIEVDIALFFTPAGAQDYMRDAALQQAWIATGYVNAYVPDENGTWIVGRLPGHRCGSMQVVQKMIPFERLLLTVGITAYDYVIQERVMELVDSLAEATLSSLLISKLP